MVQHGHDGVTYHVNALGYAYVVTATHVVLPTDDHGVVLNDGAASKVLQPDVMVTGVTLTFWCNLTSGYFTRLPILTPNLGLLAQVRMMVQPNDNSV